MELSSTSPKTRFGPGSTRSSPSRSARRRCVRRTTSKSFLRTGSTRYRLGTVRHRNKLKWDAATRGVTSLVPKTLLPEDVIQDSMPKEEQVTKESEGTDEVEDEPQDRIPGGAIRPPPPLRSEKI